LGAPGSQVKTYAIGKDYERKHRILFSLSSILPFISLTIVCFSWQAYNIFVEEAVPIALTA